MAHESRLDRELRALLASQRVAALGTLAADGAPQVSMVPFATTSDPAALVIHVSGLAARTRHLQERPRVSLLVMQAEVAGEGVHALPRVTIDGTAQVLQPGEASWQSCRAAYLARFPEAEFMTELPDFVFVAIAPTGARHVAGFGAARSVDAAVLRALLGPPGD